LSTDSEMEGAIDHFNSASETKAETVRELSHPSWHPPTGKTATRLTTRGPWTSDGVRYRDVADPSLIPRSLMTDDLYVEIVRAMLDPTARLEEIRQQ